MIDPISDMLTRIRNAAAVHKTEVILPMSKFKYNIAKILEREGYLGEVEICKLCGELVCVSTWFKSMLRLVG